jgi:hypothetical protein
MPIQEGADDEQIARESVRLALHLGCEPTEVIRRALNLLELGLAELAKGNEIVIANGRGDVIGRVVGFR